MVESKKRGAAEKAHKLWIHRGRARASIRVCKAVVDTQTITRCCKKVEAGSYTETFVSASLQHQLYCGGTTDASGKANAVPDNQSEENRMSKKNVEGYGNAEGVKNKTYQAWEIT